MKSVIINLKYLIFRSASASERGRLEERRWEGGGGWKESCCSISLICIRYFEASSNRSKDSFFLVGGVTPSTFLSPSLSYLFKIWRTHSFLFAAPDSS